MALIEGRHGDPFALLGMHGGGDRPLVVRVFRAGARAIRVLDGERLVAELEETNPAGFFEGVIANQREPFSYRLRIGWPLGDEDVEDPYRFPPVLGDMDVYLLAEGTHQRLYDKLGAHPRSMEGVEGTAFAVWAPNATRVSVIGDFNQWDGRRHPMRKRVECGVWELFLPGVAPGACYKFELLGPGGELLPLKADPFAFQAELAPATASVVHGLNRHQFNDQAWCDSRGQGDPRGKPISIYECHVGSWQRVPEENNRHLTWRELGERLIPYVAELGFTHLELLPISEHPFDGSWGYQPIGLFAPTSRHGGPEDFAWFVERCHAAGIGLLLDWVPGHFPTDAHGLMRFDGTALYEHEDPRLGFHQDWNTLIYNFGRREVANFLLSNALFWLDQYHVDGLRVDAVASMLYLDYSRKAGEWIPNVHGGRENLEAIHVLRRLNELAYGEYPGTMTVAEESTAWPGVSRPVYLGGLGFGFKWNMGWMHDTLQYMSKDPVYRKHHLNNLTFGLIYAWSENFVLPISHDEVVHGKGSLINKMPGDTWQKAANLRAYLAFMWAYPGKKLLFMGCEFGQWQEWNHNASLDWHLLAEGPFHRGLKDLVRDLNWLYRHEAALHELDCDAGGFQWIDCSDHENCVISWLRLAKDQARHAVVVCNFTPVPREGYRIGVPEVGLYRERVNTDAAEYGGSGLGNGGAVQAEPIACHGRPASVRLTLPPLSTLILEPVR
ncbi:MAG: 1,4-alpha-glucan branching protein GlgB [Geminicoccaceae bacterium]